MKYKIVGAALIGAAVAGLGACSSDPAKKETRVNTRATPASPPR